MVARELEIVGVEAGVDTDWTVGWMVMVCILVWMIIKVVVEARGKEFVVSRKREKMARIGMRSCILRILAAIEAWWWW